MEIVSSLRKSALYHNINIADASSWLWHGLRLAKHCYDLSPWLTIIQMFSLDFHDAAYCKDLYVFMVRHEHIL
jgi:hypothetical protein